MITESRNSHRKIHLEHRKLLFCMLVLFLVSCNGIAQIAITQTNFQSMWHAGQVLRAYTGTGATNVDIGKAGGPNIYDFSSLSFGFPVASGLFNVSQIPELAARFPDSAIVFGDSLMNIPNGPVIVFVPDTILSVGYVATYSADSVRYRHLSPYTPDLGKFPLGFGNSFSFSSTSFDTTYVNGIPKVVSRFDWGQNVAYDGFGTLRIPGNEFQCLRVRLAGIGSGVRDKYFYFLTREGCFFRIDTHTDQPDTGQISVSDYSYQLIGSILGVKEQSQLPALPNLHQNYPNPFNPSTTISYQLPRQSHVMLKVFDVLGREVTTLVNRVEEPGYKSVMFDASRLSSGMYYYRLQAANYVGTKKLLLLR